MALFNRNKTKATVLPELEKYYDAERRERSGLAWILALVSIAGVVLVLIGLFFGGRWIYRNLKNDKKPTVAVVQKSNTGHGTQTPATSTDKPSTKDTTTQTPSTPSTQPATPPTATTPSTTPATTPTATKPTATTPAPA